ncbi:MAG: lactoylglutathione lyase [Martelella sp.]|uniref:VOC family protein n=1 Tax=unclassified Martelella TaxID=2629616 RepID=UPI000C457B0C|nr:VOC family protein [Martelella sp.]MAU20925.1 lactoylglutathione lyase [Martelella sp.]|tara:strand:+ start:1280 stop:1720 length:441 start_codon:yes stop_codon:yes gene_type:complete
MKGIVHIGHVAIKVTDLEKSLEYYEKRLGFPEMLRLHNDDGTPWLVYLRITDDQYLEIFPGAENDRAPGWNANGVNHMCFTIEDLDGTVARIEEAGITLLSPIKEGLDGNRQAWLEDPDGNRIELMEMKPGCMQFEAIERLHREGR